MEFYNTESQILPPQTLLDSLIKSTLNYKVSAVN